MTVKKIAPSTADSSLAVIYFTDRSYIYVQADILSDLDIKQGDILEPETYETLRSLSRKSSAKTAAARICARRSVSRSELEGKLRQRESGLGSARGEGRLFQLGKVGF